MKNFFSLVALLCIVAGSASAQEHPADRIQRSNGVAIVNPDGSITVTTYAPGGIPREVRITPRDLLPPTPCTDLALANKSGTNAGLYQCYSGAWVQVTSSGGLGGGGTLTSITAGNGIVATPNPILNTGTLGLATANASPGSYDCANITVDDKGRVTAASSGVCGSGTSGTVTSVALTMPPEFTVAGSPVTGSGGFTVSKASQAANMFFAAPCSGAGIPSFRNLCLGDLPPDVSANVTLGGDVTGAAGANALSMLQGYNLSINSNTSDGSILAYNSDSSQFENSWLYNRGGFTPTAPALTTQTNISVGTDGTQTKSGGTNGVYDAGSIATNSFTTIGSINAVVGATADVWCIGLDAAPAGVDCAAIDYAMRHNSDGTYSTVENGTAVFTSGAGAQPGDVLEVEKLNGQIRYKINKLIFRVVSIAPTTTLKGVTSISTAGGSIREPLYYSGGQGTGFFSPLAPPGVDSMQFGKFASFKNRTATPPTPAAGVTFVYPKTDGHVYRLTSDGAELAFLESGGAAGGDLGGTYPNPSVQQIKGRSVGGLPGVAGFFADNFDDNTRNTTIWNYILGQSATVAETGGTLQITGGVADFRGYQSAQALDFRNKFASVQVVQTMSTSASVAADMSWEWGSSPAWALRMYRSGNTLTMVAWNSSNGFFAQTDVTWDAAQFAYWRIRSDSTNNTAYWDTSPDGTNWTQRKSFVNTGLQPNNATIKLQAWGSSAGHGTTIFDNFNTNVALTDPITAQNYFCLSWDNANNQLGLIRCQGVINTTAAGSPPTGTPVSVPSGSTLATVEMLNPSAKLWVYNTTTGAWNQIPSSLTNTAALDFPSTAAQTESALTVTVTGAADGDACDVGAPNAAASSGGSFMCYVSAANTVTVRFSNPTAGAIDPASATFRVAVKKF